MKNKTNTMKISLLLAFAALPLLFTACATPPTPRQAFHNTDNSALVIQSLDGESGQIVLPTTTPVEPNSRLLQKARTLPQHHAVVVILENYTEPQIGPQFRDRGTTWFVCLRGLGYEHIVFLQGNGTPATEGLPLLAKYD